MYLGDILYRRKETNTTFLIFLNLVHIEFPSLTHIAVKTNKRTKEGSTNKYIKYVSDNV